MSRKLTTYLLISITTFFGTPSEIFSQWTDVGSLSGSYHKLLSFSDTRHGFTLTQDSGSSDYHLYDTQNGGKDWNLNDPDFALFENASVVTIDFPVKELGYMGFRANPNGLNAFIYKTSNGGEDWIDVTPTNFPVGMGDMDVKFVDQNQGFAVSGNKIYSTSNGGNSWDARSMTTFGGPTSVDFFDGDNGIVGAWDGTFLYKGLVYTTTDGGQNWDSLVLETYQSRIMKVSYATKTVAFALTSGAFNGFQDFYRTSNAGQSWDTLQIVLDDTTDFVSDFVFIDDQNGFLTTTNGSIYKSQNGGQDWSLQYSGKSGLIEMEYNGRDVYAGGPLGTLLTNSIAIGFANLNSESNISVFPNPVSKNGKLNFSEEVNGQLAIFDKGGRLIHQVQMVKSKELYLEDLQLTPGIYHINVDGSSITSVLIVE